MKNNKLKSIIKNSLISVLYVVIVISFLIFINATFDESLDEYGYYQSDRDYIIQLDGNKLND